MGREGSGPGSGQERVGGSGVAGGLCGAGGGWKVRPRVARSRADRLSKAPVAAGAGAPGLPEPAPPTPGEGGGGGGAGRGRRGCGGGGGGCGDLSRRRALGTFRSGIWGRRPGPGGLRLGRRTWGRGRESRRGRGS